jgi:hypothetical protein
MKKHLFAALRAHFEAKQTSARATLEVYFNRAAGIGEHPQIVEEMAKQLEELENADGCLTTLNEYFNEYDK